MPAPSLKNWITENCIVLILRTKEAVEDLFYQFVIKLEQMGETEHDEVFIDGTKIESMANCYTFIWRKTTEKQLEKVKDQVRQEFAVREITGNVTPKKLRALVTAEKAACEKFGVKFIYGIRHRKPPEQRAWEKINDLLKRWEDYEKKHKLVAVRIWFMMSRKTSTSVRKAENSTLGTKVPSSTNKAVFIPWHFTVVKIAPAVSTGRPVPRQKMRHQRRLKFLRNCCG